MSTPETNLKNQIKLWCGEHDFLCFHCNVYEGKMWDDKQGTERYIKSDFPKGFPDLIVLTNNGKTFFCETKIHPRKPTKEQLERIALLQSKGFVAFVAYNLDEFVSYAKSFL